MNKINTLGFRISGQLDPKQNIPKLLEKLKSAGVDKVIAEAQKRKSKLTLGVLLTARNNRVVV